MIKAKLLRCVIACVQASHSLKGRQVQAKCKTCLLGVSGNALTSDRFLGIPLTKVLLASRSHAERKPILVICMTNHALDSFLDDLRKAGIVKLARIGTKSKDKGNSAHFTAKKTEKNHI